MRKDDSNNLNFQNLRDEQNGPSETYILEPGNVLIPDSNIAVVTVIASSVVVTIYDVELRRGGVCHFIRPLPEEDQAPTPLFGLPAVVALMNGFISLGSDVKDLRANIYGGAWPAWANVRQREIARGNVEISRDAILKKKISIHDEDVGGRRGRKLIYLSGTDEVAIIKTTQVRKSDWFPPLPDSEGAK